MLLSIIINEVGQRPKAEAMAAKLLTAEAELRN
jgi:hypothetical protein